VIPNHIQTAKDKDKDNGGNSKEARRARTRVESLEADLNALEKVRKWSYDDSNFSSFSEGLLGH